MLYLWQSRLGNGVLAYSIEFGSLSCIGKKIGKRIEISMYFYYVIM
jgi:hypothetical protein